MELLQTVPGAKEHLSSIPVQFGKEILKRRIELNWTQEQLIKELSIRGVSLDKYTISKMESGLKSI
ncbi:hypothetical protein COA01_23295 [Bacillus cereus]|uniref:hypothetical protein n=1 Tax=Bacillus cereus TaxID=1396 RepID=UPI000BFDEC98|nr:hypothetical protein [Bacillus cereus]PGP18671.1 hypothetical protein COA01_23295 [Bacillus cereus]